MKKHIFCIAFLIALSCNLPPNGSKKNLEAPNDTTICTPHGTILKNLPDSIKPNILALEKFRKPTTVNIPGSRKPAGKLLQLMQDENGNTILSKAGKPFIYGKGGLTQFTNFTTENGLALDAVSCAHLDRLGNLWFGTFGGGVTRYDGKSFVNFSSANGLANNRLLCIAEDKKGNIWFGTSGSGISCYNGRSFTNLSSRHGLANDRVQAITEDKKGSMWFATDKGISRYDGHTFKNFSVSQGLPDDKVTTIISSRTGTIWMGTDGGGISCYDGKTFKNYTKKNGLADDRVWNIFEDDAGILWVGTNGGGASRFDGKVFTNFTTADGLAGNKIRKIITDSKKNLWFGTEGNGVSFYNGTSFTSYTTEQGLANNSIWSITEDKSGKLWFGTWGGGASRYDGASFTNFSVKHGLPGNFILSIAEDKNGNMWFGTYGHGVSCFDEKSFTNYSASMGLANNFVLSIIQDKKQNLWFGTDEGGVSRYDGTSFTNFTTEQGLSNNSVWSIKEDKNGRIWFGTQGGGVSRFDGSSFTNFSVQQGLADISVYSIEEDKRGNLWFGTYSNGISYYDGQHFINFSTSNGLASNRVLCIKQDTRGNMWFATKEGLSVLTAAGASNAIERIVYSGNDIKYPADVDYRQLFKTFTKGDGLPDNYINQVLELPDGRMAIGTNQGMAVFSFTMSGSAKTAAICNIEKYNFQSGYPVKDINTGQNCMYLNSAGIVWAGTGSEKTALVRFDPSALLSARGHPQIAIKSIKIKEAAVCWYDLSQNTPADTQSMSIAAALNEEMQVLGKPLTDQERDSMRMHYHGVQFDNIDAFYPLPRNLVMPYTLNHLTFEFNVIEVSGRHDQFEYQYMLEGYDEGWSPVLKKTTATFGNIPEGTYTFKVRGRTTAGQWTEPGKFTFEIRPPFYRTWWAYSACFILFLCMFLAVNKWRERSLRNEKQILERKIKERTEELVQKNLQVEKQKAQVEIEKQRSDKLLLNILPEEVAEELKQTGMAKAKYFDNVTVLFTDFVNFTIASAALSPQELIDELHTCFRTFDAITTKYNVEKIKTIGDAYLAVAGLPTPDPLHAQNVVNAAIEINAFMQNRKQQIGTRSFEIRIGIHSGSVVAGIVGATKFAYDIWGDAVNTAARMEQSSEPGKINVSSKTYELTKNNFSFQYRGEIAAKGKGMLKMYYVDGRAKQPISDTKNSTALRAGGEE